MSSDGRPELIALLADVKADPGDLTSWQVLADWLEENGDEVDRARAEHCRLCLDLRQGKKLYASDWEKGEQRRALYRQYRAAWYGPLDVLKPRPMKGLLHLHASASDFMPMMHAGIDPETWAWVEQLALHNLKNEDLRALAAWPLLAGPSSLVFAHTTLEASTVAALVESPWLERTRRLFMHPVNRARRRPLIKRLGDRFHTQLWPGGSIY